MMPGLEQLLLVLPLFNPYLSAHTWSATGTYTLAVFAEMQLGVSGAF